LIFAPGSMKMSLVQPSLDTVRLTRACVGLSITNPQCGRVLEASCCDMGWISAERGGTQHYFLSDEKVLHFTR